MSIEMDEEIKRWTARRKSALVLDIIQGKTTVSESSRRFDLPPFESEFWIDQAKSGMENALKTKPEDIREQYESQLKALQEAYGEAMLELRARKKIGRLARQEGLDMILQIQRGLREDGFTVRMTKLCRWFDVPRRTVYYKPVKAKPKVQDRFATPIKQMIEAESSFGYRTVANLLRFNKNTVQRVFQLMGWQVRKRAIGHRPRIEALPSVATTPNERWAHRSVPRLCRW